MQTFLCYPDFNKSAQVLDYRRLGKQRVEAWQILQINLARTELGFFVCDHCGKIFFVGTEHLWCNKCNSLGKTYYPPSPETYDNFHQRILIPWENHTAVKMWRGYEFALADYGFYICREWINRGYKDNLQPKFIEELKYLYVNSRLDCPEWLGNEQFHSSHRAALLAKDYNYYSQFGWSENPVINYVWPVR